MELIRKRRGLIPLLSNFILFLAAIKYAGSCVRLETKAYKRDLAGTWDACMCINSAILLQIFRSL
jgi:hypothetical protein